ncbi:phosphatase domain-containing putative toxin [Methylotenera sp. G11]|uniref:phosphatase domain-containing putative toxin n=1 Tax=Methylotenera sp. G11 TaxID=1506585 RepID=UPI000646CD2F|nr:ATP-binding cassette domain-containing protein [Methylotenera sp. G11]
MNKILPIQLPQSSSQLSTITNTGVSPESMLLRLEGFGVTFGSNAVLSDISLSVPDKGMVVLTGPKGTERAILLRTLAGFGARSVPHQMLGSAIYRGAALGDKGHVALVAQNAQLMMASVLENVIVNLPERNRLTQPLQRELAQKLLKEAGLQDLCDRLDQPMASLPFASQRHLSVLREIVADPPLLCIDEPIAGMADPDAGRLIAYLRDQATHRALLVAVHSQAHVRQLGGNAVLVVHGRMLELQPVPQIFDSPCSPAAIEFAQTGKCSAAAYEASLNTQHADHGLQPMPLSDAAVQVHAEKVEQNSQVRLGRFMWLKRGMLAATPVPGRHGSVAGDLEALRQHGITTLITLSETGIDDAALQAAGLKNIWEPVPDMEAPSIIQGVRICKEIESLLKQGDVVAIQSDAGLGRTGTLLVAHLLWKGIRLNDALEYVRRVEPRWVQTQAQLDFLGEFAQRV